MNCNTILLKWLPEVLLFDCSAEFSGMSINNELVSDPDLTNELIDMLMQFQHDLVIFIGYIESVFYQMLVAYEHRRFCSFYSEKMETPISNQLVMKWAIFSLLEFYHSVTAILH